MSKITDTVLIVLFFSGTAFAYGVGVGVGSPDIVGTGIYMVEALNCEDEWFVSNGRLYQLPQTCKNLCGDEDKTLTYIKSGERCRLD